MASVETALKSWGKDIEPIAKQKSHSGDSARPGQWTKHPTMWNLSVGLRLFPSTSRHALARTTSLRDASGILQTAPRSVGNFLVRRSKRLATLF